MERLNSMPIGKVGFESLFCVDGKFIAFSKPFWSTHWTLGSSSTDPLQTLETFWKSYIKGTDRFLFGFIGYDYAGWLEEKVKDSRPPIIPIPTLYFCAYEASQPIELKQIEREKKGQPLMWVDSLIDDEKYKSMVKSAKELIAQGQIYEINLSRPFILNFQQAVNGLAVFQTLNSFSCMPFAAYLPLGKAQSICSFSPECFLRKEGRNLYTFPIKGTRRRMADEEADQKLRYELLNDTKEQAEHLMVVDLERNDLGKISTPGSVQVDNFMGLKTFTNLHHLVSCVSGQLKSDLNIFDTLKAIFPSGSVTGAPKVRVMQAIRDIEPYPRGAYTGALGYIDGCGDGVFSILIRTLILNGQQGLLNAGGGIVYDSDPAFECAETHLKIENLLQALNQGGSFQDPKIQLTKP